MVDNAGAKSASGVQRSRGPVSKERVDQILVSRGLVETRAKAQALILAGLVFSGERKIEKAW